MSVFPTFRQRKLTKRGEYTLLHDDSDASQNSESPRSSLARKRIAEGVSSKLCDRCWTQRERTRATKHCIDCKQNLCTVCARCDEITRPWWLPSFIVQCWRFLFTKAFIPHSIVDLNDDEADRPHWALTQEASHIQRIPRLTRTSLRSNKSSTSQNIEDGKDSESKLKEPSAGTENNAEDKCNKRDFQYHKENADFINRSKSFEGVKRQPKSKLNTRRSQSAERLPHKRTQVETKRDSKYEQNWINEEVSAEAAMKIKHSSQDIYNKHNSSLKQAVNNNDKLSRKMIGKDVNIELTGSHIKLYVNEENKSDQKDKLNTKDKPLKFKRKSKEKLKIPAPYTESLFDEVPIWFKKSNNSIHKERDKTPKQTGHENSGYQKQENGDKIGKNVKHVKKTDPFNFQQLNVNSKSYHPFTETKKGNDSVNHNVTRNGNDTFIQSEIQNSNQTLQGKDFTSEPIAKEYTVEEPADVCPICLEELPGLEARMLACSHLIHTNCLIELLQKMDIDFGIRCPVCSGMTMIRNYYAPRTHWYKELRVSTSV